MVDNQTSQLKLDKTKFIQIKKTNILNDYTIGKNLGSGSFGTVRLATHKKTNNQRAIKIIKKADNDNEKLLSEVNILSNITHPNIMQIYEVYDDTVNFYIVSEFCSGGELFDKITEKGLLSEVDSAKIVKQILSTLAYIHQNNICHRYCFLK